MSDMARQSLGDKAGAALKVSRDLSDRQYIYLTLSPP
jgi:hypothetical protein